MNKRQMQQGDVWLQRVDVNLKEAKEIEREGILAYGEATGHKHQLEDTNIKIKELNGKTYIEVEKEVKLNHEEHKTITVPPGIWEFGQVREKDWLSGMTGPVTD